VKRSRERLVAAGFLGLAFAAALLIPLYHGLTRFYLANSDQDIDLTYQALIVSAGEKIPH
jgi:hypothetical protein